jgi:DNA-binding NarL/FixJ family response regulator
MSAPLRREASEPRTLPSAASAPPAAPGRAAPTVCLVGGKRILRSALRELLRAHGLPVAASFGDAASFGRALLDPAAQATGLVILILSGDAFQSLHRVHDILGSARSQAALVVLSNRASRGQVYAALRLGAKAYVDLDAESEELLRAVRMAAGGNVYLSPEITQLLVNDIAGATDPSRAARGPGAALSPREVEVVQLLCEGLSSKEAARRLHISTKTVENHRYRIYRKCEVDGIAALMRHAIQHGLVAI